MARICLIFGPPPNHRGMEIKEFSWTNDNGNRIYAVDWSVAEARAVVGLVHGIGEHCRRYDHLAAFFAEHGIATVGYDRQGFGRSEGRRAFARDYREYVDEIARLRVQCETRYPDRPAFLYGHSMGGQLLLRYLIRRNPDVRGAIVSAPHIRLAYRPNPLLVAVGKFFRNLYPTLTRPNDLDVNGISRDPAVVAAYQSDPLNHNLVTSQLGMDMLDNAATLNDYADGLPVPVLLMHGDADRLTAHAASQAFARRNPRNLTFKSWPGLYHELHNEPEQGEVMEYVLEWMETRLGAGG